MPVFDNIRTIFIAHPIAGIGSDANNLGHMSLELAFWLSLRLQYETAKKAEEPDISVTNRLNRQVFTNQPTQDWNVRSILSATRGYKPALCTQSGQLTLQGQVVAERAQRVIKSLIYDAAQLKVDVANPIKQLNDPDTPLWDKADEVFVTADIPVRSLKLLKMIVNATFAAELRALDDKVEIGSTPHKRQIMEFFDKEIERTKMLRMATNRTKPIRPIVTPDTLTIKIDTPLYDRTNLDYDDTEVNAVVLTHQAFVPTAGFGQKARNDLRFLIKYGLLDLRVYAQGGRGRPPHIVRASPAGAVVVKDLESQSLI